MGALRLRAGMCYRKHKLLAVATLLLVLITLLPASPAYAATPTPNVATPTPASSTETVASPTPTITTTAITIQKELNQWWVIYPDGRKVTFESVAKKEIVLDGIHAFIITDNDGNELPVDYYTAKAYMQTKGYWLDVDKEEDEVSFWNKVTGFLGDIIDYIKDVLNSIVSIAKFLRSGNFVSAFVVGLVMTCKPFASQLTTFIFTITDQTELLFESNVGRVFVGFAERFGFMLWIIGFIIATSELIINHKSNKLMSDSIHDYALNTFKSSVALVFFTTVPVPLYALISKVIMKICQQIGVWGSSDIINFETSIFESWISNIFPGSADTFCLIFLIAIIFAGLKVIFSFIKRGGILMILIMLGSVHMINITRGYWDAFWSWCRQIIALCITQFCQMALFCGGMAIFATSLQQTNLPSFIAGLGMFLAATEVPRIADRYGIDTSLKGNAAGAVQTVATAARMIIFKH